MHCLPGWQRYWASGLGPYQGLVIEALARRGLLPEVSPKPCASTLLSTLSFGLVLLEYFLLEKRYLLCYLLSYLTVTLLRKNELIGISPLAEPGLDRYDASTGQG